MENPFTPDFGCRPSRMVGSNPILSRVAATLASGPLRPDFTRLLLGPRGSGKTVLLYEIAESAARNGYFVVLVDASTPGLPERIAAGIAKTKRVHPTLNIPNRRRLSGIHIGPVGFNFQTVPDPEPKEGLKQHLLGIAAWAEQHDTRAVLIVDEVHAGEREELRRLASEVQAITKGMELPLALVAAGLTEMTHTVLRDKKMTFFHRCHRDHVPLLTHDEAWNGLRTIINEAQGEITPDALDVMAEALDGSLPYHLQSLGHHAWVMAGAPTQPIDADVAASALKQASKDLAERIVEPMWHDLSDKDQMYLAAVAANAGNTTPSEIAETMAMVFSRKELRRSESRLEAAGHIEVTTSGRIVMQGPWTVEALHKLEELEARYEARKTSRPYPVTVPSRTLSRCNSYMPRVQAHCVLSRGHKGGHRSRI